MFTEFSNCLFVWALHDFMQRDGESNRRQISSVPHLMCTMDQVWKSKYLKISFHHRILGKKINLNLFSLSHLVHRKFGMLLRDNTLIRESLQNEIGPSIEPICSQQAIKKEIVCFLQILKMGTLGYQNQLKNMLVVKKSQPLIQLSVPEYHFQWDGS